MRWTVMVDTGVFVLLLGSAAVLAVLPTGFMAYRVMSGALFFAVSVLMFAGADVGSVQHVTDGNVSWNVTSTLLAHDAAAGTMPYTAALFGYLFLFAGIAVILAGISTELSHMHEYLQRRWGDG